MPKHLPHPMRATVALGVLLGGVLLGCTEPLLPPLSDEDRTTFLDSLQIPDARPFSMGFTPWPYDFTDGAQDTTYDALAHHGDLVLYHLDNGVPWPEAFSGQVFHPHMQAILDRMRSEQRHFDKVYVSATAQAQDRLSLAGYWAEDESLPLPPAWADRSFDDPDVLTAYLAYCRRLIDFFEPDYFAYGIEVNGTLTLDHPTYPAYRAFNEAVYTTLKADYPDLPLFLTFQTGSFEASWEKQMAVNRDLVEFSDYVGMSTYPYWVPGRYEPDEADLSYLPADWFAQMRAIAPDKPFAITETGYIAETFRLPGSLQIRGHERWQAAYVDRLLWDMHALDAEFVVWFVVRDYDRGYQRLLDLGVDATAFLIWRDTGLLDGDGHGRLGLDVWDRWLALPKG